MDIFVDFDETIAMSAKRMVEIYNEEFNTNENHVNIKKYDFLDTFPIIYQNGDEYARKKIDQWFNSKEFFDKLELYPHSKKILNGLSETNNIILVSKSPKYGMKIKKDFINKNLPFIKHCILIEPHISKSSIDMKNGIIIDDLPKNLNESNAKYKICFIGFSVTDYNKEWIKATKDFAMNWNEVYHLVRKYEDMRWNEIFGI